MSKYKRKHVSLADYARKDRLRPPDARNLYYVIRETETEVYVEPVDSEYGIEPANFWVHKSAITDVIQTKIS